MLGTGEDVEQTPEYLIEAVLGVLGRYILNRRLVSDERHEIGDKVGDEAMKYFAAVPRGQLSDAETASYAKALRQIGQVRYYSGNIPEAVEAFNESLEMAKELVERDPENADWQFELGQSHFWIGYAHWNERELSAALTQFEAYRDISERLVERDPENSIWQLEQAYSYNNLGAVFEQQGRLDKAERAFEAHARILEGLSLKSPEDHRLRADLADAYSRLGRVLEDRGQLSQARTRFEASLGLFKEASAALPDDMDLQRLLSSAFYNVGNILLMQGETKSALERFRSSLEGDRRLVAHDPDHRLWLAGLTEDLNAVVRILIALGELDEAGSLLDEESEITQALLEQAPDHREWRFARARNLSTGAELKSRRHQTRSARESLEAARVILQQLVGESESLRDRLWLARAYEHLGEVYGEMGDRERAAETWEQAFEIAEQLVAANSSSPLHLEMLVRSLVLSGRGQEAKPLIEKLASMGYRSISYRTFLERHGAG